MGHDCALCELCDVLSWFCYIVSFYMLLCAPGGVRDVQSIISDYFGDQDPRVRTAAIKAMVGHRQHLHSPKKSTSTTLMYLGTTNDARKSSPLLFQWLFFLCNRSFCVFVFQLQLHERGMKIHEIIYDQVTALFIFTETGQNRPSLQCTFWLVCLHK